MAASGTCATAALKTIPPAAAVDEVRPRDFAATGHVSNVDEREHILAAVVCETSLSLQPTSLRDTIHPSKEERQP